MTQQLSTLPVSRTLSTARHLAVSAAAAAVLLTAVNPGPESGAAGARGFVPTGFADPPAALPAVLAAFDTVAPGIQTTNDPTVAHTDPTTGLERYSQVAENSGGALGDYLKTIENMEPALRATPGDFARETSALAAFTIAECAASSAEVSRAKSPGVALSAGSMFSIVLR